MKQYSTFYLELTEGGPFKNGWGNISNNTLSIMIRGIHMFIRIIRSNYTFTVSIPFKI